MGFKYSEFMTSISYSALPLDRKLKLKVGVESTVQSVISADKARYLLSHIV